MLKVFGSITKSSTLASTSPRSSEALRLMKARLPKYIQECLLVSGFDTLDTIASMDDDFDNFIDQIQRFVQDNMPSNPLFTNPCSLKYVFPPDHKVRIRNFVKEVKSLVEIKKRKLEHIQQGVEIKSSVTSQKINHKERK